MKLPKKQVFYTADFLSSVIVFLIAIPLCLGIAIASGVPPIAGILTGIIGGIVVGSIGGSQFLVAGPAAGLTVLVWEIVQEFGVKSLGVILLLAGSFQFLAALCHLGQWFRAMSPAVVHGMLAGIGVLIFASQFHVMSDDVPRGTGIANLITIPESIYRGLFDFSDGITQHHIAAWIGVLTITSVFLWNRYKPQKLKVVPAPLIGVTLGTLLANLLQLKINYIQIPDRFFSLIQWTTLQDVQSLWNWKLVGEALALALIASAETLLSAVAIDEMHKASKTRYDRELLAQGIGNFLCGLVGALPMTGVIVRSTANVQAGAKSRASTILHGLWILIFVAVFPNILKLIPTSVLAAILVYTGYKLVDLAVMRRLKEHGTVELIVYLVTLVTIIMTDLLTGVITGLVLALLKTLRALSHLTILMKWDKETDGVKLILKGALTFYQVPRLAAILEKIPKTSHLELDITHVTYMDHACLELFSTWENRGGRLHIRKKELPISPLKSAS
jgi:MFS superfamily sulfate permease-like transporter